MPGKFEAPKCPDCGQPLENVRTEESSTYTFNSETGEYDEDKATGSLESTCDDCGADVYEALQDVPSNYTSPKALA